MIVSIVEGQGEVQAVPVLLRRLMGELGCWVPIDNQPVRQKRADMVREVEFKHSIQFAKEKKATGILILFDLDDDCARDIAPKLRGWSKEVVPTLPCAVVLARREYEAWFLASLESLRGKRNIAADAIYLGKPEEKRGAKEALKQFMPRKSPYNPVFYQAGLTDQFALEQAYRRCSSFRKLVQELCRLLTMLGQQPVVPTHWNAP